MSRAGAGAWACRALAGLAALPCLHGQAPGQTPGQTPAPEPPLTPEEFLRRTAEDDLYPLDSLLRLQRPGVEVRLGGEADSAHGHLVQGSVDYRPSMAWLLSGRFSRSTLADPALADAPGSATAIATLGLERSFGALGLGLRASQATQSGVLESRRIGLRPFWERGPWRVDLALERRSTTFDRLDFTGLRLTLGTQTYTLTGSAQCGLQDTTAGLAVAYLAGAWQWYGAFDHTQYDELRVDTDVAVLRQNGTRVGRTLFPQLAARAVARMAGNARSTAAQAAALLDTSATVGVVTALGASRARAGLEASRDVDHFTGEAATLLTALFSFDPSSRSTLEFRAGATRAPQQGTVRFAGVTLVLRSLPRSR